MKSIKEDINSKEFDKLIICYRDREGLSELSGITNVEELKKKNKTIFH